jgi:Flp pilus assembly protein TadD
MRIVSILLVALFCCSLRADVILLKDGTRVEGDLKRGEGGYDVTDADGKVTHVASTDVQSIQLGKSGGAASAMEKLASMRRSVDSIDDLNRIIARYQDFIKQNAGTPAAKQAEQELAGWQEKLDQHMVRVAGKWVTAEQQEQMLAQSGEIVKQAYDLMKENKLKEAEPVLKQALAIDPGNPVANYLEGVLQFRSEKIVLARKSFETAHEQLPSDAATLNNMAVCAWRQNQPLIALGFYCDAMLAMPANKEIVNNVAEALYALKDDMKKAANAQRASRLFIEQEAKLESTMAQYGWYRWGSTWLSQEQLNELKKSEQDVKDKMAKLQKDYDDVQKKIRDNQDQMKKDQDFIDDLRQSLSGIYDPGTGQVYRQPYPQSYYDAQNEITRLDNDDQTLNHTLDQYRGEGKRLEASMPKPKYSGVQNLIGVEGAPKTGLIPDTAPAPTSAPAAVPAPASQPTAAPAKSAPAAPAKPATSSVF